MAKLPPYSIHANRIEALLDEGRKIDAVRYAVAQLRAGHGHQLFLNAVADLLDPRHNPSAAPRSMLLQAGLISAWLPSP
jgi:hypothetical protein